MLDYTTDQADLQSPLAGPAPRVAPPTVSEAFSAATDANDRLNGVQAAYRNQETFWQQRMDAFTAKTGVALPKLQITAAPDADLDDYDNAYRGWMGAVRSTMQAEAQKRNDPTLLPPSEGDVYTGGLQIARGALQRQADLSRGPAGAGMMLGSTAASLYNSVTDPYNAISAVALTLAPEGAPLLAAALRTAGAMGAQQLAADAARYGYRRQVDPTYGPGSVAGDVLEAAAGGALFGAGHVLGGEGVRGTLGTAAGGAVGGAALGALHDGAGGALQGVLGGAAIPLFGAGVGMTARSLGASWRALVAARPELASDMPLNVRDAGTVAAKAGDLDAQNPNFGPNGAAIHAEAVTKIESDLLAGRAPELPAAAAAESQVRRGQVFFPGGAIEARYGVAEAGDLVTSHDADFNVRPDYPAALQPRDRGGAPARDQVTNMAGNLEPERLGPSVEANAGAPIVGPDGVVESGNGRTLAISRAYDMGRGDSYRQWLEGQGYDTTGFDRPILVGMRETPMDDASRVAFAHAANGSAALRMSATEQALSDARLIDGPTLDLHAAADLGAAANRDFARALVAKLPQGERGGMLTRDGSLSAGGVARARNALTARAYGDPGFLSRALDHPDPNIKAIAGAMGDAAGPWARLRDAVTRGDIEPGHDITRDVLQAVHAIMRARDEGRPAWEMLNQGDIFQSDTTQLAARMFFRDEEMRQAAGRARIAEALTRYAEEAAKNTKAGRLFADDLGVGDVLRRVVAKVMPGASDDFVLASVRKIEERDDWLGNAMRELIGQAEDRPAPPRMEHSLEEALREIVAAAEPAERGEPTLEDEMRKLIGGSKPERSEPEAGQPEDGHTIYHAGDISYADEAPEDAIDASELDYGGEGAHDFEGESYMYDLDFTTEPYVHGDKVVHAIVSGIKHHDENGNLVASEDHLTAVQFHKLKKSIIASLKDTGGGDKTFLDETAAQLTETDRYSQLTPEQQRLEDAALEAAQKASRDTELQERSERINRAVDDLVDSGWRPTVNRHGGWQRPDVLKEFASPSSSNLIDARLRHHGIDVAGTGMRAREAGGDVLASLRRTPEDLTAASDQAAKDVLAMARKGASRDQLGFDFGAAEPQRNPLIPAAADSARPTAEAPKAKPTAAERTPFQSRMHALADTLDKMAADEVFGETPSGVNKRAYERHRALSGAVKDIAKGIDRVFSEIARVAGDEDVDYGGDEVWEEVAGWGGLHNDLKEAAQEMRADMRDPDLVGEEAERPHTDLREIAGDIAKEVRGVADTNPWIERAAGEEGTLHPDDLDHLADHVAGIGKRFDQLMDEIGASSRADWRTQENGDLELRASEGQHVSGAQSLAEDLREAAQAQREAYAGEDVAPRLSPAREGGKATAAAQPDLTLRNPRTGADVQAQAIAPLAEMLKRFDISSSADADPLARASALVIGKRLADVAGGMRTYTVGPEEMRGLAEGRMRLRPGYEPAGFWDQSLGALVMLDDALRDPAEAAYTLMHEGVHGALGPVIDASESAFRVFDHLRETAVAAHLERGGSVMDHYGLTGFQERVDDTASRRRAVHEFVAEGNSRGEMQRLMASIPLSEQMAKAFGLAETVGNTLWDAFVGAVRKILGFKPEDHSLLDAFMRVSHVAFDEREAMLAGGREPGAADQIAAALRLAEPDARRAEAVEAAKKARAFADAKSAIAYRIAGDRIAQHPDGPLAGFLGLLTRDIRDASPSDGATRNNVEALQQYEQGRFAGAMEHILEPYGSKWAGLKQDVVGPRDMIREIFGVDTGNETARVAAHAWREGVDKIAVDGAKKLGKVFTAAEDWRVPQWWESRRAQKFGKDRLLSDMRAEIASGGLRVFDATTGEEANPIRRESILSDAAEKIVTDASLGGTHGGAFKNDMRVFRFADGSAGAESYIRLMEKYGPGRGGIVQMMQQHVVKVSRELGLLRVLGPDWMKIGEQLLQDTVQAHAKIEATRGPRDLAQRAGDLPGDVATASIGWLESPAKAEAVWQHMSGQASGVGSELMAGLLAGTRDFLTATRMGSALVTAMPADTVNVMMAANHNGLPMGRMVSEVMKTFAADTPERREQAAGLGIAVHAGIDAAIGTKRFQDEFLGSNLMRRMANFVIRAQGLHPWDSALQRVFPMEFLRAIGERAGKTFDELDESFAGFLERYGLDRQWEQLARPENMLPVGEATYLHPDKLDEPTRVKLMSAIYDERQFAYLAGGTERVRAISAQAKAGTLPGEAARSIMQFKNFSATMWATWGLRAAQEASVRRFGTAAGLLTGMTFAGALSIQARAMLQGKDPQPMKDPWFWGEAALQGGALGIYGDFFKEAFSRSDTSLTETMMGPLAAIPASVQGLTSGARRAAEDGQHVNFGSKLSRIISDNVPGSKFWYARLIAQRAVFDNIQRMIDPDYARAFARQQQRAQKTYHQGFFWAPGDSAPARAPDIGAMLQ